MRTYRFPGGGLARALRHLGALVCTLASASIAHAQERRYLFEVGASGAYQSYADDTGLDGAAGGLARIGVWLPVNFSLEAEGSIANPNSIGVKAIYASALYNVLLGSRTWAYAKAGVGGTRYGGSGPICSQEQKFQGKICGTTTSFVGGLGVRIGLSPVLMLRAEGVINPNRGTTTVPLSDPPRDSTVKFSNYGVNVGVSLMLGSKPIPDSDGDGILNNRDRCAGTPAGAQVDGRGCPADSDGDGVPNGVDRCPNSGSGALVDAAGCSQDSDGDNIADGIDKCPDTPSGVLVDSNGCPRDSDGDSIADGLDRCSDTPKGATVDALGCPGDEDSDGVLDGLDRCPRTPAGATVNAAGCSAGQQGRQPRAPAPAPPVDTSAARPPQPRAPSQPTGPAPARGQAMVLEGVTFGTGSARLQTASYVELDSIAKVLAANPNLRVEISGHTDEAGSPADNMHLSNLRAEAVRNYLVARGVPFQQMVARGYGASMPRTPDTTPRGRAANRRVEIRPIEPGQ
jgi:outer membrane protein OmpA-like peptidoglycan-associated protein/opacity protein-like surface antigen